MGDKVKFFMCFLPGEGKPKKQPTKKKRSHKAPLTRKQRMRQQISKRMLMVKAGVVEVYVHAAVSL
jgi:hypothetical protein